MNTYSNPIIVSTGLIMQQASNVDDLAYARYK